MKRICNIEGLKRAFTLIELLVVIAIIALLAGLTIGLSGTVVEKNRRARVVGEHARLVTAIETYKLEVGTYPPDNDSTTNVYQKAQYNSLFYELSGAIFASNTFTTLGKTETISTAGLRANFGVDGIQNSSRRVQEVPFRGISFKPSQYAEIKPKDASVDVEVLVVPIRGPEHVEILAKDNKTKLNPWLYDTSSTNRHNPETFDLWTEYLGKNRTNVIGNWKE